MNLSPPILPGSIIGIVGGGQLGRMFIQAAHQMGYRVHVFTNETFGPASQVADRTVEGAYTDFDAIRQFAQEVDVVTVEFENIPAEAMKAAASVSPVRPGPDVLRIAQNRNLEKTTLQRAGFPVTPFKQIGEEVDLVPAAENIGFPAVLKAATNGYDGKGQTTVHSIDEAQSAWRRLGGEQTWERRIEFDCEISVVAARNAAGDVVCYEPIENQHRHHILDLSMCPARIPPTLAVEAMTIARALMDNLKVEGVLCVEFFVVAGTELMINEVAPRPHNSGHLTMDACATSQFEQQVRAVCGLPLGDPQLLRPAAMINLLGELWQNQSPDWLAPMTSSAIKLHLYNKQVARPGRKMGHLTALGKDTNEAVEQVRRARNALQTTPQPHIKPALDMVKSPE